MVESKDPDITVCMGPHLLPSWFQEMYDMNIYVGNLPFSTSENDLSELFGEHGQVISAKIIIDRMTGRSRGFGFVEMENDDEAKAAIEALDQKEFQGRTLKVNEARPREERPRRNFY
jgi:RNA recognition motif-containing protein